MEKDGLRVPGSILSCALYIGSSPDPGRRATGGFSDFLHTFHIPCAVRREGSNSCSCASNISTSTCSGLGLRWIA